MSCCKALKGLLDCPEESLEHTSVASRKSKEFRIEATNGSRFCRIDLDKVTAPYLINYGEKVADYIFICCNKKQQDAYYEAYFFVELKGGDIGAAVKQVENTITNFRTKHNAPLDRVSGYIVSVGVPTRANQKFQNEQERLRKKQINLYKGTDKYVKRYP